MTIQLQLHIKNKNIKIRLRRYPCQTDYLFEAKLPVCNYRDLNFTGLS